ENMRIGIAPIEKSTRYVDYSKKVNGRFLYYTDPSLEDIGLRDEYEAAMDGLFTAYTALIPQLASSLQKKFPDVPIKVIEKKAFDTLRGLLPMATLSQVSFFGNGQAFEYMMARSLRHPLGEIRWAAEGAYAELSRIGPSFFRRLKGEAHEGAEAYQEYLANRKNRMTPFVKEFLIADHPDGITRSPEVTARLIESDPQGEAKVIAGMLYGAPNSHRTWKEIYEEVLRMPQSARKRIVRANLEGRDKRWQRVSRAFEHAYTLFEIEMNIGAWRDLHRHRMLTQEHQFFSCHHGYDTPPEIAGTELETEFSQALGRAASIFEKIEKHDPYMAQYAVPLAYRVRFIQRENLRQSFWQIELRTISQGHPDYRHVEQEKYRLLKNAYPLLASYILADMTEYDFARRETDARIEKKKKELENTN
ncbi:MAG: FAD-dependent thymidylate synthase, partial [Patescibacteria group bacterium]